MLGQLDRPRLLVRVRLLGRFIWAEDDRTLHVDGQLFGTPNNGVPRPRSFADFPSGNGAGVVVLKRLSDAQDDGDTIIAVIRASAINNDGAVKAGFTAPGVVMRPRLLAYPTRTRSA